jgi:hypothetical protein
MGHIDAYRVAACRGIMGLDGGIPPPATEPLGALAPMAVDVPLTQQAVTGEQVASLLRSVGAPEPFANPAALNLAAVKLTWLRTRVAEAKRNPRARGAFERAQDAIDELRRVLPEIHAWYSLPGPDHRTDTDLYKDQLAIGRSRIEHLQAALFDVIETRGKPPVIEGTWHDRAATCCQLYILITESGSVSKHGPACRFVQAALRLLGDGDKELGTIEQALRRRTTNGS